MFDHLAQHPIIPVIAVERLQDAVPLARALVEGGLSSLEITLRTSDALAAIEAICTEVPQATVGAGTLLTAAMLESAERAGASYFVSPGATESLLAAASGRLFLPGVSSPSDMMRAADAGFFVQKFFPAQALGGADFLRSISAPLPLLRFCATGGVNDKNLAQYFAAPNVIAVGGSWMGPASLVQAGRWQDITDLARRATAMSAALGFGPNGSTEKSKDSQ